MLNLTLKTNYRNGEKQLRYCTVFLSCLALLMSLIAATLTAPPLTVYAQDIQGSGGSSVITLTNATIGKSYAAYRIFDASVSQDGSSIVYTLPSGKTDLKATPSGGTEIDGTTWFDLNTNGVITAKAGFENDDLTGTKLDDDFVKWAIAFGTVVPASGAPVAATETTLNFKDLPYGYYMITSTLGDSLVTVTSTRPTATIIDKNQTPSWDNGDQKPGKVIRESGQSVSVNKARLGEPIAFDIGVRTTNYNGEEKINKYIITDVLAEGMTYLNSASTPSSTDLSVGVNTTPDDTNPTWETINLFDNTSNKNGYSITYYKDAAMSIGQETTTLSEARSFKIEIPWVDANTSGAANDYQRQHLFISPAEIHVGYYAMLDPAKADKVLYNAANDNVADFTWKEVDSSGTEKDTTGNPQEVKTETYITELEITKNDDKSNLLSGAEFALTGPTGEIIYTRGSEYVLFVRDDTQSTNFGADADADGNLKTAYTYWKLKDGTYTTTDPTTSGVNAGAYESTENKYMFKTFTSIQGANQTNTTISAFSGSDGKLKFSGLSVGAYKLTETKAPGGYNPIAPIDFYVTFDAATKKFAVQNSSSETNNDTEIIRDPSNNILVRTVVNTTGSELPNTGGLGRTILYVMGAFFALTTGVLMTTRRLVAIRD